MLHVKGETSFGREISFYARLPVPQGETGEARLKTLGLELNGTGKTFEYEGETYQEWLIDNVAFDSPAEKNGLEYKQQILDATLPNPEALRKEWMFIPGIMLLLFIAWVQRLRAPRRMDTTNQSGEKYV